MGYGGIPIRKARYIKSSMFNPNHILFIICSIPKRSSLFRPLKNGALTALLEQVQSKVRKFQSDIEGSNIIHLIFIILFCWHANVRKIAAEKLHKERHEFESQRFFLRRTKSMHDVTDHPSTTFYSHISLEFTSGLSS